MKLPRWLVVCLLVMSGLGTLSVPVWFWVTWPERTAEKWFELIRLGRFDQANAMMISGCRWEEQKNAVLALRESGGKRMSMPARDWQGLAEERTLEVKHETWRSHLWQPRSLSDYCVGRERLRWSAPLGPGMEVFVERGTVLVTLD